MVGTRYEQGGIIKDGAKLINAVSNSTVPHLTLMVGASYGAGNYGMSGRAYDPRFVFTWPNHRIAVMGPEQLAGVLSIVARQRTEAAGQAVRRGRRSRRCARRSRSRSRRSRPRSTRPAGSGTTASSTRATPAPCSARALGRALRAGAGREQLRRLPDVSGDDHRRRSPDCSSPTAARSRAASSAPAASWASRPSPCSPSPTAARRSSTRRRTPSRSAARTSAESYLDADDPRRRAPHRRRRVHPGYGFLSENADFAAGRAATPGLVWVGPPPASIARDGLEGRGQARSRPTPGCRSCRVPSSPPTWRRRPARDGGAGRLSRCWSRPRPAAAARACASCARPPTSPRRSHGARREAAVAFGDATVFLERYLERVAPRRGAGLRRHARQRRAPLRARVLDPAPAPEDRRGVAVAGRDAATARARCTPRRSSLAAAIGYVGAGTVEFLVAGEGDAQEFFFLEMNTRLQVEHPVTEMVTGPRPRRVQLAVARGRAAAAGAGRHRRAHGHAIEVRLYAEDPAQRLPPQHRHAHAAGSCPSRRRACASTAASSRGQCRVAVLRPDARQGDRARRRRVTRPRGSSRRRCSNAGIRGVTTNRVAGRDPGVRRVPGRRHHHRVPRREPRDAASARRPGRRPTAPGCGCSERPRPVVDAVRAAPVERGWRNVGGVAGGAGAALPRRRRRPRPRVVARAWGRAVGDVLGLRRRRRRDVIAAAADDRDRSAVRADRATLRFESGYHWQVGPRAGRPTRARRDPPRGLRARRARPLDASDAAWRSGSRASPTCSA